MGEATTGLGELEDRILPWSQVKVISGLSRTTVWRLQKTGDFPASVQVSRNRVGWWQSELLEWKRSRLPRRLPTPRPPSELADTGASATARSGRKAPASREPETFAEAPLRRARGRKRPSSISPQQGAFDF